MKTKTLKFCGWDSWDRPVYEDEREIYWKDIDPRPDSLPKLCTAVNNEFDGEPDWPIAENIQVFFEPNRMTW